MTWANPHMPFAFVCKSQANLRVTQQSSIWYPCHPVSTQNGDGQILSAYVMEIQD